MASTEIDLFGIVHVKVEFIPVLKIYTIPILGRFVWSTNFVRSDNRISYDMLLSYFYKIKLWQQQKIRYLILVLTPIGNPPNSMDDCIEGIEEPLYGFRANVILLKDFPCILGVTCNSPSFSGN